MECKKFRTIDYVEKMPTVPGEKMPVLIYLHGAGARRGKLEQIVNHEFFNRSVMAAEGSPLLTVAPLCYANSWFEMFEELQRFVNMIASRPDVDSKRVYLMGASMGGYGTWQLAMTLPDLFAAIVPICGGGMYWDAYQLRTTPVFSGKGTLLYDGAEYGMEPGDVSVCLEGHSHGFIAEEDCVLIVVGSR